MSRRNQTVQEPQAGEGLHVHLPGSREKQPAEPRRASQAAEQKKSAGEKETGKSCAARIDEESLKRVPVFQREKRSLHFLLFFFFQSDF